MKKNKLLLTSILSVSLIASNAIASSIPNKNPTQNISAIQSGLSISDQWIRMPADTSVNTAAYFNIQNNTDQNIKIVEASIEGDVCKHTEIHGYKSDDHGVMRMFKLESITIPAKTSIEFKPGSNHIMLMGLNKKFVRNSYYNITLKFLPANAENNIATVSKMEIKFPVK